MMGSSLKLDKSKMELQGPSGKLLGQKKKKKTI